MAYKNTFDPNKNLELIKKADDMDTQDILQYSLINNFPLFLVIDSDGNNLIHLTINNPKIIKSEFNKLNFIKFLIQNNVNPDQPNKENQTPLHLACQSQYETIVNLLLENNVNVNYKDNNGLTPLHYLYTGNIKLYQEREIKEFILPNKSKENIINRENLFVLKMLLWKILKGDEYKYFFQSLSRTIKYYIDNSPDYKKKIDEFKFNLVTESNSLNNNIISDKYKNLRATLNEIVEKNWKDFPNDEDIMLHEKEQDSYSIDNIYGIIKNADIKKVIKTKLKNTINECINFINDFNYDNNDTNIFEYYIKNILNDIIKDNHLISSLDIHGFNNFGIYPNELNTCYFLNNQNINNNLSNTYIEYKHPNSVDLADNIIDFNNFTFIGGSRQVTIDDRNYDIIIDLVNNFDTINKKVIFILLCHYHMVFIDNKYLNLIIEIIIRLDNNNYRQIFTNIMAINFININNDIINYINFIRDFIYKPLFINKSDTKKLYGSYLKYISRNDHTNINCQINKVIIKLFAAIIHNPLSIENSFNQIIKIDNFVRCINTYNEYLEGLSVWTGYLLDNDYYRRMSFSKYEIIYLPDSNVLHNEISNTIKDKKELENWLKVMKSVKEHYRKKWGGCVGSEKYKIAFNK